MASLARRSAAARGDAAAPATRAGTFRQRTTRYCSRRSWTVSSSSARPMRSIISSSSAREMISGGLKHRLSPGTVRPMTPFCSISFTQPSTDLGGRVEILLGLPCRRPARPRRSGPRHAPHRPADDRRSGRAARLHVRADVAHMAADIRLVVDLQRLDRDGRRHRMAGVGEAVAERADRVAFLGQALEHACRSPSRR